MKTEEGWGMYIDIHRLKSKGFSKSKIAKKLGISRQTVTKYLDMNPDQFEEDLKSRRYRVKKPDIYQERILSWLKEHPDISTSQIYDWLEETFNDLNFNESTLRNYVRMLRKEFNITKEQEGRQYEAVDELPMGKQMQVDFGEKKVANADGKVITLYVMCFVLSHSRHKYCEWQGRPFNTTDIIKIHENAIEFYGGIPEEVVYDQDHLILVSENHGDLIYTKEFAAYQQKRKFSVHMCRKADPESKGRIEKVVDYVKSNFASHRKFYNIDRWNEDCQKWLERRANGKVHQTTRKIPAEVFLEEKKYLRPVTDKIITKPCNISITYQVRKDNTVPIKGNRYTVPRGTYKGPHTYVGVTRIGDSKLIIYDLETNEELASHEVPPTKGNLVKNNNHRRDNSLKFVQLMDHISAKFSDQDKAMFFMEEIHREKPRYTRDQLALINSSAETCTRECMDKALDYCVKNRLYSGTDFKDAIKHYSRACEGDTTNTVLSTASGLTETATGKISAVAHVRDISEYINIMNNSKNGG